MANVRAAAVANAHRGVRENARFDYTEGPLRMADEKRPWPTTRITCDCSAAVTYWVVWAGAADPNGLNSDGYGYTGTLLSHDEHIAAIMSRGKKVSHGKARSGDLVVYGPYPGWHVGFIVETFNNPDGTMDILTVSHGRQGDPHYVWAYEPVSGRWGFAVDGRLPLTIVRPNYRRIGPVRRAIRKRLPAMPLGYRRPSLVSLEQSVKSTVSQVLG